MDLKIGSIIQAKSNGIKAKVLFINRPSNIIQIEYLNPPVSNYSGVHAYCLSEFIPHWNVESNHNSFELGENSSESLNQPCIHDWKRYQGFIENYQFCTKCDLKKNIP